MFCDKKWCPHLKLILVIGVRLFHIYYENALTHFALFKECNVVTVRFCVVSYSTYLPQQGLQEQAG